MLVTKEMADLVREDWVRLGRNRRSLGLIADLHGTSKETISLILGLELSEEDREFLMDCFNYEADYIKRLSKKYEMTGSAVRCKKEKLLKTLREKFFE